MRWEWGERQHSLARVLLGHLDTEGMNSELGGRVNPTQCRTWLGICWSLGMAALDMLHPCRVGGG